MDSSYQNHLAHLHDIREAIQANSVLNDVDPSTCDVDALKLIIQRNKVLLNLNHLCSPPATHSHYPHLFQDSEKNLLSEAKVKLEDTTLDVQCFLSENTQFLSPAQSSRLLKSLSSVQRAFRDQAEMLASQRSTWDILLDTRERDNQEKVCLSTCGQILHFAFWNNNCGPFA